MFELLLIILFIIINGLFAMAEMVIVSSRKSRLQQLANEGKPGAHIALALAKKPTILLSTTQAGITLIGIMIGAIGEATLSHKLDHFLHHIPALSPYSSVISFSIVIIFITFLSIIIGELVPKRLGLYNPERLALVFAPPMLLFARIASPLIKILSVSTDSILWILHFFGLSKPVESSVTEEEINVLIEQGTQTGEFEEAEQNIIERVFKLNDQHVERLMIPRTKIIWIDIDDSSENMQKILIENNFTRFPVCKGNLDHITGIIHVKDLLCTPIADIPEELKKHMQPPLFVPKQMRALKVLEMFKQTGMFLAVVIDEYGSILGLVSLNDILQMIIGTVPSDDAANEADIKRREDGAWLVDGMLSISKFKELVNVEELPEEHLYRTLAGFIMTHTGSVPSPGDYFMWENMRIEVLDMDGNRIDKVLITIIPQTSLPDTL